MSGDYAVTISFDPTAPRGMRWSVEVRNKNGAYMTKESPCFSRRSAERKADRYIRRLPGKRTYTYEPKVKS